MRRRATVVVIALAILFVVALFLTLLQQTRAARDVVYTANNLRELGQFLELNPGRPDAPVAGEAPGRSRFTPLSREQLLALGLPPEIPAGARGNPELPLDSRLSFFSVLLPTFNQARQPTAELARTLDLTQPWDAPPNRAVAETPLGVLQVYANPLTTTRGEPALTPFVGLGGVGAGAPAGPRTPASGAFRYAEPTPFALVTDGLSETGVYADASVGLGPWLQAGPATVRTFDPARPAIGPGAQFGGNFPNGALVGYADHSVRFLVNATDAAIVANLATCAGAGKIDPIPGE